MLRSETLFGKRETPTPNNPLSSTGSTSSMAGSSSAQKTAIPPPGMQSTQQAPTNPASQPAPATAPLSGINEGGSKLVVGPNIQLKGEITDCDTLVVEGRVEATMDSRVIQIAERGAFKGSAEIDIAEIRGEFDGDLTVRQKLVIYSTGRVSGKIRYGKVVIEEGGQLSGDVQVGSEAVKKGLGVTGLVQ